MLAPLVRSALLCAVALSATAPSLAGLSIEQMQARHRALLGLALPEQATGELAAQAGERPGVAPPLIADPIPGGPGVSAVYTLVDRRATSTGIELRLGAVANEGADHVSLVGSSLTVPAGPGELYASYERRHWGPGWFGSLILDGAAAPIAAAGWRRQQAGAVWQADLFAGTLRGHTDPADPKLFGMRLEWRPTPAWTIALARVMQWGGEGRDENLRAFFNALIGRDSNDDHPDSSGEPGNQLAGGDVRYDLALDDERSLGFYLQIIAEDFTGVVQSRRMWMVGADGTAGLGDVSARAIVELADTTAGKADGLAYRHHIYKAGYTHRGAPLGHPIAGDARLATGALLLERGPAFALLALHYGRAVEGAQRFVPHDELRGADLALTFAASEHATLGVSGSYWRAGSNSDRWATVWARYSWR
jgi:hypothetical protein